MENEKITSKKYSKICLNRHIHVTPFIVLTYGMMGHKYTTLVRRLAPKIS